jgi:hypothetical protein
MKTYSLASAVLLGSCLALAIASAGPASAAGDAGKEPQQATEMKKTLYHVVSIKFKDNATKEQIKAVEDAFQALKGEIPGITSLEWGTNVSPENLNKGYTHCFVLTFASDKDRDAYLTHPAHKAFGTVLKPVMADVMVIDFWAHPKSAAAP